MSRSTQRPMPTASGKNNMTRTGDATGGTPTARSGASTMGETVAAGPVRSSVGRTLVRERTRGYIKLSNAARALGFSFKDKVVLDIGSSTGGFTQYALDHGAKKVIAIEKGTKQMLPFLRNDPRVELHEKTDIFDVRVTRTELRGAFATTGANDEASPSTIVGAEQTKRLRFVSRRRPTDDPIGSTGASKEATKSSVLVAIPGVVLADVSFISLRSILEHVRIKNAEYLVMLKPQFEAEPNELNKGVVKNEHIRRDIIKRFELWLKQNGFIVIDKHDNELKGKTGNLERFYYLKLAQNS